MCDNKNSCGSKGSCEKNSVCDKNTVNQFACFNVDQLVPVLTNLELGKTIVNDMIKSLACYVDEARAVMSEVSEFGNTTGGDPDNGIPNTSISGELQVSINKGVEALFNELTSNVNKTVSMKRFGTERLFSRLSRGISYRYKMSNGIVVESDPNNRFVFNDVVVDVDSKTICVGTSICLGPINDTTGMSELSVDVVNSSLQSNISIALNAEAVLDVVASTLQYAKESLEQDVMHFNLFDKSYLHLDD
jgi:hypothetical protein